MKYLGGKSKISKWIVAAIAPHLRRADGSTRPWWDAFCGGLSVSLALSEVAPGGVVSDANAALVALYQAVAAGWAPPTSITPEEYEAAKTLPDDDPRKAFIGFGCSFGARWFQGFARGAGTRGPRNYADESARAVVAEVGELVARGCSFARVDFLDVEPEPTDAVIYCDPPYAGTTRYVGMPTIDHDRFYERVAGWASYTDVFVSEYDMPQELGGQLVLEFQHTLAVTGSRGFVDGKPILMGARSDARVERLYHFNPKNLNPACLEIIR